MNRCIWTFLVTGIGLLPVFPSPAKVIYVDGDNAGPGTGAANNPYRSLEAAIGALAGGDTIRIRDSATPYDAKAVIQGAAKSGTPGRPTVIEADPGHRPVLTRTDGAHFGPLSLIDVDHMIVRGLTFDGGSVAKSTARALAVYCRNKDAECVAILENRFFRWGKGQENASTILLGNYATIPYRVRNALVKDNYLEGNYQRGIQLIRTLDAIVEGNEVTDMKCGWRAGTPVPPPNQVGIHILGMSGRDTSGVPNAGLCNIGRNNRVHHFDPICTLSNVVWADGIWADVCTHSGKVYGNTVHDIALTTSSGGNGIHIEHQCNDWEVFQNVVHDVGQHGLRNRHNSNTRFFNNTVYKARHRLIMILDGDSVSIFNNILVTETGGAVEFRADAVAGGGHQVDNNLYFGLGVEPFFTWAGTKQTFLRWRENWTGCDAHSAIANPYFMDATGNDFRLLVGSPAVDAGRVMGLPFLGRAPDLGAYEQDVQPLPPSGLSIR
ncbi:MAG: right-handed parallel beta-helix repeat-containing protein [Kiritimatiellae bacterium]|nr:right-handed parallel beta-helix repeat-containing protein [Kiritimatiellia bacterium]